MVVLSVTESPIYSKSMSEPASVIVICPDHAHVHFDVEVKALCPAISAPLAPGDHGPVTKGMHGIGVSAPMAAAVAAATCGFACVLHIPKGEIFTIGRLSATVAAGTRPAFARLIGSTVSWPGASPSLHLSRAPFATSFGMGRTVKAAPYRWQYGILHGSFRVCPWGLAKQRWVG
jgi:hypothetical protein